MTKPVKYYVYYSFLKIDKKPYVKFKFEMEGDAFYYQTEDEFREAQNIFKNAIYVLI